MDEKHHDGEITDLTVEKEKENETKEGEEQPPSKRQKKSIGEILLEKAGYKGDGGLGRHEQGINELIKTSDQVGVAGLGFEGALKRQEHEPNTELTEEQIDLLIKWEPDILTVRNQFLAPSFLKKLISTELWKKHFLKFNLEKQTASKNKYEEQQQRLLKLKSRLDSVDEKTFNESRTKALLFEKIDKEGGCNRAFVKLHELDAHCQVFSSFCSEQKQIYVADLCGGPGGFVEALMTRFGWQVSVIGITLKTHIDYQPLKFRTHCTQTFLPCYGGQLGTGDLLSDDNVFKFAAETVRFTETESVDVVLGDGSVDADHGKENEQEYLNQPLVLAELATTLRVLKKGGTVVLKVFDIFGQWMHEFLYLFRCVFGRFAVVKPNTSRAANSERYIVAFNFLLTNEQGVALSDNLLLAKNTLLDVNKKHKLLKSSSWLPNFLSKKMEEDVMFLNYIDKHITMGLQSQEAALQNIIKYMEDPNLPSRPEQTTIRWKALAYWQKILKVNSEWRPLFLLDQPDTIINRHPAWVSSFADAKHIFMGQQPQDAWRKVLLPRLLELSKQGRMHGMLMGTARGVLWTTSEDIEKTEIKRKVVTQFLAARARDCRQKTDWLPIDTILEVQILSGAMSGAEFLLSQVLVKRYWSLPHCSAPVLDALNGSSTTDISELQHALLLHFVRALNCLTHVLDVAHVSKVVKSVSSSSSSDDVVMVS
jgi:23S rRNA U2552 (ribose-2'-O)-methylase RlmE/FtsJ